MEQPILSSLKLEFSISNDRGDKIVHMQHELVDRPENPTEDQINQVLQEITKSVALWLKYGQLSFEAQIPPDEPTIEFKGQSQTFPTDVTVFSAKLPEFRDGIIKGVPSVTLRKTY